MTAAIALRQAVVTLARDSLESTPGEVEARTDDGEITVAMQAIIRAHRALDFIASDATITPAGCPEPWRSTLIEWAQAANFALDGVQR